ncbi:MAG: hypothetical protein KAI24_02035 [Planctomycetes bacterium]|nr:hypothetical protein [Planctomycetota bacterium]
MRTFERRLEAEHAKSLLDAAEIPSLVLHDDAGGWWGDDGARPMWAKARLLVPAAELARAEQTLAAT